MLSQTTEYALRAMACLACHPEVLTPTPELAKRTAVPSNYLAKVLQSLAQSDLILGRRGVGGGYKLARPASEITLLDTVNAISPMRTDDRRLMDPQLVHEAHLQVLHDKLDQATQTVRAMFASITLQDLVDERESLLADGESASPAGLVAAGYANSHTNGHANGHTNGHGHGGLAARHEPGYATPSAPRPGAYPAAASAAPHHFGHGTPSGHANGGPGPAIGPAAGPATGRGTSGFGVARQLATARPMHAR